MAVSRVRYDIRSSRSVECALDHDLQLTNAAPCHALKVSINRANQLQGACNTQQGILWRSSWRRRATSVAHTTSLWLSRASITSSAAARSLAASLDAMLSHRASASATWNLGGSGHCRGCPTGQPRHQELCRSVGSTIRHDAMLTGATLSHAGNAETE